MNTMLPIAPLLAVLTTPLFLLLLVLLILNGMALARPTSLLSRLVGTALLVPLLALLSLPLQEPLVERMLQMSIPLLGLALVVGLQRSPSDQGDSWRPERSPVRAPYGFVAVAVSLAVALLFALRPVPFEYPGDATDYLQQFIQTSIEQPGPRSCLVESWSKPTYERACTIWSVIQRTGHIPAPVLLSGIPQRLMLGLEISVLGLSMFRLLQAARVGPLAASLSWGLTAFGLGNQAIAFLVNNGLQGSILAAAIFLEAVMLLLWLLQHPPPEPWQSSGLLLAPLFFTFLELKLHGAFALLSLLLVVPLAGLVGATRLWSHGPPGENPLARLKPSTARRLLLGSLLLLGLLLTVKNGWLVSKDSRTIVSWTFLASFGWPREALPASYFLRSPGSRPEILAVASLLIGLGHLARQGWFRPQRRGQDSEAKEEANLYLLIASLYGLAILLAFVLPPLSHLYINLPYEIISNYRLMWGCVLFSPLPCLLERALRGPGPRWPAGLLATVIGILVLIPVPSGTTKYPQRFWSKSRHILQGASPRVDLLRIASALMPTITASQTTTVEGPVVVLADELIGSALAPYGELVEAIHPSRVDSRSDLSSWETHGLLRKASNEIEQIKVILGLRKPAQLVIQEKPIGDYYSPYAEIGVYDKDLMAPITRSGVNQLSAKTLEKAGFQHWKWLDAKGRQTSSESGVYRVWRTVKLTPNTIEITPQRFQ